MTARLSSCTHERTSKCVCHPVEAAKLSLGGLKRGMPTALLQLCHCAEAISEIVCKETVSTLLQLRSTEVGPCSYPACIDIPLTLLPGSTLQGWSPSYWFSCSQVISDAGEQLQCGKEGEGRLNWYLPEYSQATKVLLRGNKGLLYLWYFKRSGGPNQELGMWWDTQVEKCMADDLKLNILFDSLSQMAKVYSLACVLAHSVRQIAQIRDIQMYWF